MKNMPESLKPNRKGRLKVDRIHSIYWEEWGNRNGIPAVFVHGGPGGSTSFSSTRFFDLRRYRVVLFDQRGCGKSRPRFCLEGNTTDCLVGDMEALRGRLGIDRWLVFGGSWGSTLGLCYAIKHPERVSGLVLRGIFLGREHDWSWMIEPDGVARMFPEKYAPFVGLVPQKHRGDIMGWYYKRLRSKDAKLRKAAGTAWSQWELDLLFFKPKARFPVEPNEAYQTALMECHYAVNGTFFPNDDYILGNAARIKGKPCWLIHGEYDYVCPPGNAFDLKAVLPKAKLWLVKNAGHSSSEPGIFRALRKATAAFAKAAKG